MFIFFITNYNRYSLLYHNFYFNNICHSVETGNSKYTDHKIENSGIYYDYFSKIKITADTFKLINFVNTTHYEIKYDDLIDINNKTITFCRAKSTGNVTEIF